MVSNAVTEDQRVSHHHDVGALRPGPRVAKPPSVRVMEDLEVPTGEGEGGVRLRETGRGAARSEASRAQWDG